MCVCLGLPVCVRIDRVMPVLLAFVVSFSLFSSRKRGSMFLPALVCVSVCDHDN